MPKEEQRRGWADQAEVDEEGLPRAYETMPDHDGIKTVVSYKKDDNGNIIKVTRKIKVTKKTIRIPKGIAERKKWARFGACMDMGSGVPEQNITLVGDEVFLEFAPKKAASKHVDDGSKEAEEDGPKLIQTCRICGAKGEHWSHKCPYKDAEGMLPPSIAGKPQPSESSDTGAPGESSSLAALASRWSSGQTGTGSGTAKYVPPSMRERGSGERMSDNRDRDNTTLRITNLSEETTDQDLQDLFRPFGSIGRTFLARDRDTGIPRGYAFVSYHRRSDAEAAKAALDGHGLYYLVLKVEWAKPSVPRDGK